MQKLDLYTQATRVKKPAFKARNIILILEVIFFLAFLGFIILNNIFRFIS
ncbi:MAG: hypothetical protein RLN88_04390 [Ekhidna sp.]